MEVGQRLAALRKRKHLTQDQIAEDLGVKRATYNAWEHGIGNPNYTMLLAIAKYYHVSVDFLLGAPAGNARMLSDDMYADGYTDEDFFSDLEKELEEEAAKDDSLVKETRLLARKYAKLSPSNREVFRKLMEAMDDLSGKKDDEGSNER